MQKHRILRVSECPWSVSRASPEHPRGQNTVFYDGFHASAHKNTVFYVFLCVPRASSGRFQSIPELKTPYLTVVFTPRNAKTTCFTCFCVLQNGPTASPGCRQSVPELPRASLNVSEQPKASPERLQSTSRAPWNSSAEHPQSIHRA